MPSFSRSPAVGETSDSDEWKAVLRAERERFREEFLGQLPDSAESRQLSARLSGSEFFIKDLAGRYVHASAGILGRFGLSRAWEIAGTRDEDHFPPEVAAALREEEQSVLASGTPVEQRFDLRWEANPGLVWYEISKDPLRDERGVVLGLIGTERPAGLGTPAECRHLPVPLPPLRDPRLAKSVEFIVRHCHQLRSNGEIAEAAGVSERQLSRLFLRHFRTPPGRFCCLLRARLACQQLAETDEPIESIARDFGFSDQSSFTNRFRSLVGTTPGKFRKQRRSGAA